MNQPPKGDESRWQRTHFTNLVRCKSSKTYFARIRIDGKLIRRSLDTTVLSVAKLRLADLEAGERKQTEHQVEATDGRMTVGYAVATFRHRLAGDAMVILRVSSYCHLLPAPVSDAQRQQNARGNPEPKPRRRHKTNCGKKPAHPNPTDHRGPNHESTLSWSIGVIDAEAGAAQSGCDSGKRADDTDKKSRIHGGKSFMVQGNPPVCCCNWATQPPSQGLA
jgi:hypothetical protein